MGSHCTCVSVNTNEQVFKNNTDLINISLSWKLLGLLTGFHVLTSIIIHHSHCAAFHADVLPQAYQLTTSSPNRHQLGIIWNSALYNVPLHSARTETSLWIQSIQWTTAHRRRNEVLLTCRITWQRYTGPEDWLVVCPCHLTVYKAMALHQLPCM